MKINIIIFFLISSCIGCIPNMAKEITGSKLHQYYAGNKVKLSGTFPIEKNDLIIHAKSVEFGSDVKFSFTKLSDDEEVQAGKVIINCKKIKGMNNYHIEGLKADEIQERFKILIK